MNPIPQALLARIHHETGWDLSGGEARDVSGGCIHQARILESDGNSCFIKSNTAAKAGMFEAERDGLLELEAAAAIRVPHPYFVQTVDASAFLVMEAIALRGQGDAGAQGRQLAALHRREAENGAFGWHRDNVIGETPQPNPWTEDWGEFFAEHRLEHQFRLLRNRGTSFSRVSPFVERIPELLGSHRPAPSLLHGDLWSGNAAFDDAGQPVLFDPATYFGDRETDLAFTHMFGGFTPTFYSAYEAEWPLPDEYREREPLYNLYHVLNHALLFGGSYADQAQITIDRFV